MSITQALLIKDLIKNVDNYVSNVYKGQFKKCLLEGNLVENTLKNKNILIKDIKI